MLELEAFELEALKVILHYARLKDIWGHKLYRSYVIWVVCMIHDV